MHVKSKLAMSISSMASKSSKWARLCLALALTGAASAAKADPPADAPAFPEITKLEPTEVVRNGAVVIRGASLPTDRSKLVVWLGSHEVGAPVLATKEAITFVVPGPGSPGHDDIPLGRHVVRLQLLDDPRATISVKSRGEGELRVISDAHEPLKVFNAVPSVNYHDKERFALTLTGAGFSPVGPDNQLLMDGREVKVCWRDLVVFVGLASAHRRDHAAPASLGQASLTEGM
jgi:hypothetical protein